MKDEKSDSDPDTKKPTRLEVDVERNRIERERLEFEKHKQEMEEQRRVLNFFGTDGDRAQQDQNWLLRDQNRLETNRIQQEAKFEKQRAERDNERIAVLKALLEAVREAKGTPDEWRTKILASMAAVVDKGDEFTRELVASHIGIDVGTLDYRMKKAGLNWKEEKARANRQKWHA
jgi:hypothetical protein